MKRKGFTLIELLVVIAIIGLLSTLAVVALNSARQRSRDAKRVADIRQVQTALELAFSETSGYPTTGGIGTGVVALGSGTGTLVLCKNGTSAVFQANSTGCTTTYMGLVPSNPTPGGADYSYSAAADGSAYRLTFSLEGATGQLGAGANCANANGIQAGSSC